MALTRVSRHIIDEPFNPTTVSATDVTATNINASGIGTVGTLRVTGDLTVEGTTTTLDSILTEVDRLEVSANSTVAAGIITQTGSGDILNLFDGSTEVFTVTDGGKVGIEAPNPSGNLNISYLQVGKGQVSSDHSLYNYNTSFTNNAYQNGNGTFAHITNRAVGVINIQDNVFKFLNGPGGTAGQSATLTERFTISSDGNIGLHGQTNPTDSLHIGDFATAGYELKLSRNALQFKRAGNSFIDQKDDAGHILFRTTSSNTERLRITSDGKVRVPDNGKFVAGAGDDLQIYHDGSTSYIKDAGDGNLNIETNGSAVVLTKGQSENLAKFIVDGAAELYYDNSKKLETKSDGVDVTGELQCDSLDVDGPGDLSGNLTIGGELNFMHGEGHKYIDCNLGSAALNIRGTSGGDTNHEFLAKFIRNGAVELYYNNALKFATTTNGVSVTGQIDIGTTSLYSTGDISMGDNDKLRLGGGDDLQIYHTGSHSLIDETGTGNLTIRSSLISFEKYQNEQLARFTADGGCEFYHDNSKKLETTTTGAKVTGALEVTQEYPSIRPTLDLNFAATKTLDRRITFTRDSVGTYIDENGLVKYASNNVPRFDHDFDTRESLGLLIEESRTNKFTYSTTIGGTGWTLQGTTADYTTNTTEVAAPDGTFTALKWNPSSIPQYLYQNLSNIGTTQSTMSVWVRCPTGQSRTFFMNLYSPSQNNGSGSFTATDQWQRFTWTFTPQSQANVYPIVPDSTGIYYVWGPQLEEGAFATSYIPTSGSTVTRAVDTVVIKGTNFTDLYNVSESTIFFESGVAPVTNSKYFTFHGSDGGGTELIEAAAVSGPGANIFTYSNSTVWSNISVTDASATTLKYAAGIKANDINLAVNGTLGTTDTSSQQPDALDKLIIGNYSSGNYYINTSIKKLSYYNKRLPNAQLQGLTQQ